MAHEIDRLTPQQTPEPFAVVICPSCAFPVEIPRGSTVAVCWCYAVVRVPEALYKAPAVSRRLTADS